MLNSALDNNELDIATEWLKRPGRILKPIDDALAALKTPLLPNDYLRLAAFYARGGRPDRGRQFLARFEVEVKDTAAKRVMMPGVEIATADALIEEGKPLEAIAHFRRADRLPDGPSDVCHVCMPLGLAVAYDRAGVADSALKYYEHYATTYDYQRYFIDPVVLVTVLKRLGELYEQKGDREKAGRYYQSFVNLWKNADPELQPQVAEARRKLSRLADIERR